jgi:hypothetical protein
MPSVMNEAKQNDDSKMANAIDLPKQKIADLDLDLDLDQKETQKRKDTDKGIAPGSASATGVANSVLIRFMDLWNEHCRTLPSIREITKDREKKLRAKLKVGDTFEGDFLTATKRAAETPFLCGQNETGWRANFDWLLDNVLKVLEGSYDSAPQKKSSGKGGAYHGGNSERFTRPADFTIT